MLLPVIAFAVTTLVILVVYGGVAAFFSWTRPEDGIYQMLAVMAMALLVAPLLTLSESAVALSARSRSDRLASVRLLGASSRTVRRLPMIEATLLACVGALIGVAVWLAVAPLVGLIQFRGAPLGAAVMLAPVQVAIVVLAVTAVALGRSVTGLRRVLITPLGVRTRQDAEHVRKWIVVIGLGALVVLAQIVPAAGGTGSAWGVIAVICIPFTLAMGVLRLTGPAIVGFVARRQLRQAQDAAQLVAARTVLESPQAAWHRVAGVAMASFVAVVGGVGFALIEMAGPGGDEAVLAADVRTGVFVVLAISFVMVACSVGVDEAGSVLDRKDLVLGLDRSGTPRAVMERARARAVVVPLLIASLGSAAVAGVMLFPLVGIVTIVQPLTLLTVAATLVTGVLLVRGALWATRPVVRSVIRSVDRH